MNNEVDDVYFFMKEKERALNAAARINNYTSSSINELIRNNKLFQEQDKEDQSLLFVARNKRTREEFTFRFTDLYGYEGEVNGIIIGDGKVFAENNGCGCVMNPKIEIRLAKIEDRDIKNITSITDDI